MIFSTIIKVALILLVYEIQGHLNEIKKEEPVEQNALPHSAFQTFDDSTNASDFNDLTNVIAQTLFDPAILEESREKSSDVNVTSDETSDEDLPCVAMKDRHYDDTSYLSRKVSETMCELPECIHSAAYILRSMNKSVNPCDNFYQFTCGGYIKENIILDGRELMDHPGELQHLVNMQIKESIRINITKNDPKVFKQIQSFYNACMDEEQIYMTGPGDLRDILTELGSWPILEGDSWNETNFDWENMMQKIRSMGFQMNLFDLRSKRVVNQSGLKIISLSRIKSAFRLTEETTPAYSDFMLEMTMELMRIHDMEADEELVKKEMIDVLGLEYRLSTFVDDGTQENRLYEKISMRALYEVYPNVSWTNFMINLRSNHVPTTNTTIVDVYIDLEYFLKLINKTSKRVIANYFMWKVTEHLAHFMEGKAKHLLQTLKEALNPIEADFIVEGESRGKKCLKMLQNKLPLALGAIYVRKYVHDDFRKGVSSIVANLKKSLKNLLIQAHWLSKKRKSLLLEKLDFTAELIAYPNEFLDNDKLDEYHENLKIVPNSYLKSYLSLNRFKGNKLHKTFNRSDWTTYEKTANIDAFYDKDYNSLKISAAILQGVYYTQDRPQYLNYGAIGYILGHELAHAVDYTGGVFDMDYRLIKNSRRDKSSREYLKRARCLVEQYDNYTDEITGLKINGSRTLAENVADNAGIKEAYYAYNIWEKENYEEPHLPGLNYTSQQMFWIAAANTLCANFRPRTMENWVKTYAHSPQEFRVIGMMSNMYEFSRDFNCSADSRMNPPKKFGVWR